MSTQPGSAFSVDISISATKDFAGGDFSIGFDPNAFLLAPPNARTVGQTSGFSLVSNPQAGSLKISMANATGISSASGPIFEISFVANGNATAGVHSLRLTAAALFNPNGESIACSRRDGSVLVIGSSQGQDEDDEDDEEDHEDSGNAENSSDGDASDPQATSGSTDSSSSGNESTSSIGGSRVVTRRVETASPTASPVAPGEFAAAARTANANPHSVGHGLPISSLRPDDKGSSRAKTNSMNPDAPRQSLAGAPVKSSSNLTNADDRPPLVPPSAAGSEKAKASEPNGSAGKKSEANSWAIGGTNIPVFLVVCMGGFLLLAAVKKKAGLW
ncbi:hypothetical protein HZA56_07410 [Candidatus Poribacteria bacterium]|nr:hypothetical protein [Candidatus Poribacteria bacterium]